MPSGLTPIMSQSVPTQTPEAAGMPEAFAPDKNDTREYLADMLRELSAIAAWAELHRAREMIEAALHEVEGKEA
jgi:hypothetical protein